MRNENKTIKEIAQYWIDTAKTGRIKNITSPILLSLTDKYGFTVAHWQGWRKSQSEDRVS